MTKKTTIIASIILLALLSIKSTYAQYGYYDKNMSFGLVFNPNMSFLSYGDAEHFEGKSKVGYAYGLVADFGFDRNYYFSTGLTINTLMSERSTNLSAIESNDPALALSRTYRIQYAEIPLSIKLKTNEGNLGKFYGQFGLTTGIKVSGKEKVDKSGKYSGLSGDDIFRLGLLIGAGGEWRLTNSLSAITGIAYNNGFTRTMKQGSPKLSYLSLQVGLLF